MFNILKTSLDINIAYSVNSFLYVLRKLPILEDLLTEDVYSSKIIKKIVTVIGLILSSGRAIFSKLIYYGVILLIATKLFYANPAKAFIHIYFFLTLIGLFINNKLLNTSCEKYFSIILFNMDATKFFKATIFWNTITNLLLNIMCFIIIHFLTDISLKYIIVLIIYTMFIRFIGEALNIIFYKKYKYIWYANTNLYFSILTILLLGGFLLPYLNIFISLNITIYITIITTILGTISLLYLSKVKDYKLIYKKLSQVTNVMDNKNEEAYLKQAMVSLNKKDKEISDKKIAKKEGFDYFNTIFFERHKEILLRSAKKYSLVFILIYLILGYISITNSIFAKSISSFLQNKLSTFVIIMFFINRGSIITQAMFLNCDHAMLRYNFYREPGTLLGLFKKRLLTVIKVNLIPALVIGIGNVSLLLLTKNYNLLTITSTFFFILVLSIFFSVHYLVIYYLLQPFNKEMEIKKVSYSLVTLITYIISYNLTNLVINSVIFSVIGLISTIIYIIVSLILVYRFSPRTFKLN